jgi:hypothetical protein
MVYRSLAKALIELTANKTRAWLFAAGLILGFEMFATSAAVIEIDSAFRFVRNILQKLGARSPQALHYNDILENLEEVINNQRIRKPTTRSGKAVRKFINITPGGGIETSASTSQGQRQMSTPAENFGGETLDSEAVAFSGISEFLSDWQDNNFEFGDILREWGNPSLGSWD